MIRVDPEPTPGERPPLYDAHPAIAAPIRLRIDYARVVASLCGLGQAAGDHELCNLRRLCGALGLPPGAAEGVIMFAHDPQPDKVRESLEELRDTDLQLTLLTDLVALAMSDGKYDIAERKQIHAIAALMLVGEHDVAAIEDYVAHGLEGGEIVTDFGDDEPEEAHDGSGGELSSSVAAASVPVALLWLNCPDELSLSGLAEALDAIGFGMGPLVGFAVDVGIGLVVYGVMRLAYRAIVGDTAA